MTPQEEARRLDEIGFEAWLQERGEKQERQIEKLLVTLREGNNILDTRQER